MQKIDLKNTYLKFFEEKGHKIIPSAPVIPENEPTLDLPTKTISGKPLFGYCFLLTAEISNCGFLISNFIFSSHVWSQHFWNINTSICIIIIF